MALYTVWNLPFVDLLPTPQMTTFISLNNKQITDGHSLGSYFITSSDPNTQCVSEIIVRLVPTVNHDHAYGMRAWYSSSHNLHLIQERTDE